MDMRKIGGVAVFIAAVGVVLFLRMDKFDEYREEAMATAMALLPRTSNYDAQQSWYESRGKLHASAAFDGCVEKQGAGRRAKYIFDEQCYLQSFFERMITAARDEGNQANVEALVALQRDLELGDVAEVSHADAGG